VTHVPRIANTGATWDIDLGIDGLRVSRLAFGTGKLLRVHSSRERQRLLATAYDLGITHFDTARSYGLGEAEAELGRFLSIPSIRAQRQRITVATKFGIPVSRLGAWLRPVQATVRRAIMAAPGLRAALARRGSAAVARRTYSVEEAASSLRCSLSALRQDSVDILFLHEPTLSDTLDPRLEAWLAETRLADRLRSWGLSGTLADVEAIRETRAQLARVCQYAIDAVGRIKDTRVPPRPRIGYRPFADSLPIIHRTLVEFPDAAAAWRRTVDVGDDSLTIASLLLNEAIAPPHNSCVVFSSTRSDHLESLVHSVRQPPEPSQIEAFRAWLTRYVVAKDGSCAGE
jgi:D-threo-aldose 1-dehydrogenase